MAIVEKDCENICTTLGYKNVKIIVLISNDEKMFFSIEKITINLKNAELTSDNNHIDITKQIKNEISSKYSLNEEQVTIYEWRDKTFKK